MEAKYTKDGKKVAVLGKLNSTEFIVQEIFVSGDQEFPAGENFIAKGLLDQPAETYQSREEHRYYNRVAELRSNVNALEKKLKGLRRRCDVNRLMQSVHASYQNADIDELADLMDFLAGNITHIVMEEYGSYSILPLDVALESSDNYSLDGLKLVTLFGCDTRQMRYDPSIGKRVANLSLNWAINTYPDGSGQRRHFYPCRSEQESKEKIDELIKDREATDDLIQLKEKYNLKYPSDEKIKKHKQEMIDIKRKDVQKAEAELTKRQAELTKRQAELTKRQAELTELQA
jgi:hypothetical protein